MNVVEFKIKVCFDKVNWESINVVHIQQYKGSMEKATRKANKKAGWMLEHLALATEVRWNFEGSFQGHYLRWDDHMVAGL